MTLFKRFSVKTAPLNGGRFFGEGRGLEVKFSFEYKKRVRADFLRLVLFLGGQPLSNDFSLLFLVFLVFFFFVGKALEVRKQKISPIFFK